MRCTPMRYMLARCMPQRCIPLRRMPGDMHAHETHAREICAHEIHESGRCGEFFDLSPSLPLSRGVGDALRVIFGAKSSAEGVTDPWDAITNKGRMR
jgi:hypothetical protein